MTRIVDNRLALIDAIEQPRARAGGAQLPAEDTRHRVVAWDVLAQLGARARKVEIVRTARVGHERYGLRPAARVGPLVGDDLVHHCGCLRRRARRKPADGRELRDAVTVDVREPVVGCRLEHECRHDLRGHVIRLVHPEIVPWIGRGVAYQRHESRCRVPRALGSDLLAEAELIVYIFHIDHCDRVTLAFAQCLQPSHGAHEIGVRDDDVVGRIVDSMPGRRLVGANRRRRRGGPVSQREQRARAVSWSLERDPVAAGVRARASEHFHDCRRIGDVDDSDRRGAEAVDRHRLLAGCREAQMVAVGSVGMRIREADRVDQADVRVAAAR